MIPITLAVITAPGGEKLAQLPPEIFEPIHSLLWDRDRHTRCILSGVGRTEDRAPRCQLR